MNVMLVIQSMLLTDCNQQIVWADIHRTLQRDVGQPLVAEVAPHPAAEEGQGPVGPGGMGVGLWKGHGPWKNHGKTTGKPWENGGFMGFHGIYPLAMGNPWVYHMGFMQGCLPEIQKNDSCSNGLG